MPIYLQAGQTFKIVKRFAGKQLRQNNRDLFETTLPKLHHDTFENSRIKQKAAAKMQDVLKFNGPYTITGAEKLCKKLGVKARFANIHLANLVSEALINLKKAGIDMKGLQIKGISFKTDLPEYNMYFDLFVPEKKTLFFNLDQDWSKLPILQERKFNLGNSCSDNPLHNIYKSLLTVKRKQTLNQEEYWDLFSSYDRQANYYLTSNDDIFNDFTDFIAEVGAGLMAGKKFPNNVMSEYKRLGGLNIIPDNVTHSDFSYLNIVRTPLQNLMDQLRDQPVLIRPNLKIRYKSLEYKGPYSIAKCVEMAKKLGINAEYSDEHIANFSTEALINLTKAGVDLSGLTIKCEPFTSNDYGEYLNNVVKFNSEIDWKNIKTRKETEYKCHFKSTPIPNHTCVHELIHAAHLRFLDSTIISKFKNLYENDELLHKIHYAEVSAYAAEKKDFVEFIAETAAGLMYGKKYSKEVMSAYRILGGPELKIIHTEKKFTSKYQQYLDSLEQKSSKPIILEGLLDKLLFNN